MRQAVVALAIAASALFLVACGQTRANLAVEVHLMGMEGNAVPLSDVPVALYSSDPDAAADSSRPVEPEVADTTDRNGVAWLRGLRLGRWWVQARFELPENKEIYWNVPVDVTKGAAGQVILNRENGQVRPIQ